MPSSISIATSSAVLILFGKLLTFLFFNDYDDVLEFGRPFPCGMTGKLLTGWPDKTVRSCRKGQQTGHAPGHFQ